MPKPPIQINLFYLSHNPYGGWANYTAHLKRSFESYGIKCNLYKIREGSKWDRERNFGYGVNYQNIGIRTALKLRGPKLITALGGHYKNEGAKLLEAGAFIVRHDPYESKFFTPPENRTIAVRKSSAKTTKGAVFIPHPYIPIKLPDPDPVDNPYERYNSAISISRIDSDKKTEMILQANRMLPENKQIVIRGFAHTSYARFYLAKKYPEFGTADGGKHRTTKLPFPKDSLYNGVRMLSDYWYSVDLSVIRGDGGGTQYTFLEAWNAETVQIVNKDWLIPGEEMKDGHNCIAVSTPEELASMFVYSISEDLHYNIRCQALYDLKRHHSPERVIPQYLEYLT